MSDRPYIKPNPVIVNGNMNASITSAPTILAQKTGASYDLNWTGAPVGAFSVEVSNSYSINADGSVASAGNWAPVTLSGPITATGTPDNAIINLAGLETYAVRLVFTRTSGTGTLNALICSKVQ